MIQPQLTKGDIGKASQVANLIAQYIGMTLFSILALAGVKKNALLEEPDHRVQSLLNLNYH